jgi:hypothetical protein
MNHYFQFPLCALSFLENVYERLNCIISFGCIEVGKKQWQKFNPFERQLRRSELPSRNTCPVPIDLANDEHLKVAAGAEHLRVVMGNIERMLCDHSRLWWFIKNFEAKNGRDAQVRIRKDLLFEARDAKGISYQELAVLAAIYSKIGASKRPVRISRDDIWRRAHGFKSDRVFRAEMNGRSPFMTARQVRSVIDRLHDRGFFARVTYGRRHTYYSHRMSKKELSEAVFELKTRLHARKRASRMANAMLTERIQAERRKLAAPVHMHVIKHKK